MHYSLFQLVFVWLKRGKKSFKALFYRLISITCIWISSTGERAAPDHVVAPNREEVEVLLPPLEPQYCVEQAMNAILIDQPLVCIPRLTYLPVISRA